MEFSSLQNLFDYAKRDRYAVTDAEWEEAKHPRDESGQFASGNESKLNKDFTGNRTPKEERKKTLQVMNPVEVGTADYKGKTPAECRAIAKDKYSRLNPIKKDGIKIEFPMRGFKETRQHSADLNVMYVLGQMNDILDRAVFMYKEPNTDEKKTNTLNILNYAGKTRINGTEYYTRIVIREDKNGNFYYDNDCTEVEKVKANLRLNTAPNAEHHENSPYIDRITQWLAGVKSDVNNKHDIKNALEKTRAKGQPQNRGLSNNLNITHDTSEVKSIAELWRMIKSA
ncbi:hypothetical protein [uncultured Treponema sp.]|uniref:LPD3 domain-containing protein n=1 Tax=uncultured Treponema sp. TaxID=162155 RepID=UPI0025E56CAC|nr:hypothetical protein [uncultured Treponema sp.]